MLRDRFDRKFGTLRISVTDRCNFRCVYCMPEQGVELSPRADILSFEEVARVAGVAARLGMAKVRLTGGEPLVRRDLHRLVSLLRSASEIQEIALTTNAALLADQASALKEAGLDRVNISLDTLRPERAKRLARRDFHAQVLAGIDAAARHELRPKLNAVVLRGANDDELCDLVGFAHARGATMRFIEWMPMGQTALDNGNALVPVAEMRTLLSTRFDLAPDESADPHDAARLWVCRKTGARVGFISSMSEHFCDDCNRMRLTALGGLRPCLHQDAEVPTREILRSGAPRELMDQRLRDAFSHAAALKWAGHRMTGFIPLYAAKDMVSIGG
jgi:cyclic pyranopterin phosphate synthase